MDFNEILKQQVKQHFPDDLLQNPGVLKFLEMVNNTYNDFERNQELKDSPLINDAEKAEKEIAIKHKPTEKIQVLLEAICGKPVDIYSGDELALIEYIESEIKKRQIADGIFDTLVSHLKTAIILADGNGNVIYINNIFCQIFGFDTPPSTLLGKNINDLDDEISALVKKEEASDLPRDEEKGPGFVIELTDSRFLNCNKIPFVFEGKRTGELRAYTDITETIKAQEFLKERKKITEEILNSLPVDIAIFDTNHNYLYVNPNTIRNEERRRAIIGSNDFDYFMKKGTDNSKALQRRELFKQAIERKATIEWFDEEKTANNEIRYMQRRFTPYYENDILRYVFDFGIEAIDSKHYEDELAKKDLELDKLNSELDTFVYSASHNLRSPLTSIVALVDLILSDRPHGEELEDYIDKIKTTVERLDSTIYDIMDYSKNSRLEIKPTLINIEELINNAFSDIKFFNKAQIQFLLTCNISANFYSDEKRISSVVANLISNSVKYYDENKPQPFLKIDVNVNELNCVISFEDNGIGIPTGRHQKVFEMFYRNTNKAFGSGLGLFIVKEMMDKLNGEIDLASADGVGTKFTLTIPNMISFW